MQELIEAAKTCASLGITKADVFSVNLTQIGFAQVGGPTLVAQVHMSNVPMARQLCANGAEQQPHGKHQVYYQCTLPVPDGCNVPVQISWFE